jgi:hypothetical protein
MPRRSSVRRGDRLLISGRVLPTGVSTKEDTRRAELTGYRRMSLMRVISEGAPKRFGGPQ